MRSSHHTTLDYKFVIGINLLTYICCQLAKLAPSESSFSLLRLIKIHKISSSAAVVLLLYASNPPYTQFHKTNSGWLSPPSPSGHFRMINSLKSHLYSESTANLNPLHLYYYLLETTISPPCRLSNSLCDSIICLLNIRDFITVRNNFQLSMQLATLCGNYFHRKN